MMLALTFCIVLVQVILAAVPFTELLFIPNKDLDAPCTETMFFIYDRCTTEIYYCSNGTVPLSYQACSIDAAVNISTLSCSQRSQIPGCEPVPTKIPTFSFPKIFVPGVSGLIKIDTTVAALRRTCNETRFFITEKCTDRLYYCANNSKPTYFQACTAGLIIDQYNFHCVDRSKVDGCNLTTSPVPRIPPPVPVCPWAGYMFIESDCPNYLKGCNAPGETPITLNCTGNQRAFVIVSNDLADMNYGCTDPENLPGCTQLFTTPPPKEETEEPWIDLLPPPELPF